MALSSNCTFVTAKKCIIVNLLNVHDMLCCILVCVSSWAKTFKFGGSLLDFFFEKYFRIVRFTVMAYGCMLHGNLS